VTVDDNQTMIITHGEKNAQHISMKMYHIYTTARSRGNMVASKPQQANSPDFLDRATSRRDLLERDKHMNKH
jgi:hypothetical protein